MASLVCRQHLRVEVRTAFRRTGWNVVRPGRRHSASRGSGLIVSHPRPALDLAKEEGSAKHAGAFARPALVAGSVGHFAHSWGPGRGGELLGIRHS